MKKLFFVIVNIVLVSILPKLSFSYVVQDYTVSFHWDDYDWDETSNNYINTGNGYIDQLNLYVEPNEIYTNNKALINFNLELNSDYYANASNVVGQDIKFYTHYDIVSIVGDYSGCCPPNSINAWEYTPFVQIGTTNYTSYQSSSTATLSAPVVIDTGVLYTFFPYAIASLSGDTPHSITPIDPPQIIDPNVPSGFSFGWRSRMQILSYSVSSIPEPSTLLLLGSGLVGLMGFGRKKFRK